MPSHSKYAKSPNKLAGIGARLSLIYIILTMGCESIGASYNFAGGSASAPYATQYLITIIFLPLWIKFSKVPK